jgi:hypothetical protein
VDDVKTRAQAAQELSDFLAEIRAVVAPLTPMQAAQRAWSPGDPPVEVLARQIAEDRARIAQR